MRKTIGRGLALLVILSLALAACGDNTNTPVATTAAATTATTTAPVTTAATTAAATTLAATTQAAASTASVTTTAATSGEVSVTDGSGAKVTVKAPAQRVVCVGPPCIEILADLEILPAGSTFFNMVVKKEYFGEKSKQISEVGGTTAAPDLEQIAKLKPDLIIGEAGFNDELRPTLEKIAPYFLAKRAGLTEPYDNLRLVGQLTGKSDKAEEVIKKFDDKLAAYKAKSPKDKTFFYMSDYVLNPQVATKSSAICMFLAQVTAGCVLEPPSTANPRGMVQYSLEKIIQAQADTLIIGVNPSTDPAKASQAKKELEASPFWKELNAVKSKQVYEVDTQVWTRTQLRSIGIMLDDTMTKLYPTVFPKPLP